MMAPDKLSKKSIHWQAPATILFSLFSGVLFAVGHHCFYQYLNGQRVNEARFGQQTSIRIGTAASYLVRVAFVVTISTSYWQVFWRTLHRKKISLHTIDSLADLLSSLSNFCNMAGFRASPILVGLAAVSWLVPLASLIAPATLTIDSVSTTSHRLQDIAGINFAGGPLAQISGIIEENPNSAATSYGIQNGPNPTAPAYIGIQGGPNSTATNYRGSTQPLIRLALATALQGEIPSIPSPGVNSSYRLNFQAPSVRCKSTSKDILKGFDTAMGPGCQFPGENGTINISNGCKTYYNYLAWVPSDDTIVPFAEGSMSVAGAPLPIDVKDFLDIKVQPNINRYSYLGGLRKGVAEPATIFVAVDRSMYYSDWSVLNCSLWNTTYTVDFDFLPAASGSQSISIVRTIDINPVSIIWTITEYQSSMLYSPTFSYAALMECLGRVLVGSISEGTMNGLFYGFGNVLQTDAAYAEELFPIYNTTMVENPQSPAYQKAVLSALQSSSFNRSLGDVIEEMFQNMTLALFSKPIFLTEGDERMPTNVTFHSFENVYNYQPANLLLAYSLAVGFSVVAASLGLLSIWSSQAAYSFKFSTVMRTTCDYKTDTLIPRAYRSGEDNLPRDLRRLEIRIGTESATLTESDEARGNAHPDTNSASQLSTLKLGLPVRDYLGTRGELRDPRNQTAVN
ncbi:hypothetical protein F4680DRAFT_405753 [Xylaria scruposa]|nr:hypothetical protein F4680DRAFT_405753 [Xylaria scruposa]